MLKPKKHHFQFNSKFASCQLRTVILVQQSVGYKENEKS